MRWLKATWRDPVGSNVIAAGIVGALGILLTWAWQRHTAAAVGFWFFFKSETTVPGWLFALLTMLALASVVIALRRLFAAFGSPREVRLRDLSQLELLVLRCLAFMEGKSSPTSSQLAKGLSTEQVEIEHALDKLIDWNLVDAIYGYDGRSCYLTSTGREYVIKNNIVATK